MPFRPHRGRFAGDNPARAGADRAFTCTMHAIIAVQSGGNSPCNFLDRKVKNTPARCDAVVDSLAEIRRSRQPARSHALNHRCRNLRPTWRPRTGGSDQRRAAGEYLSRGHHIPDFASVPTGFAAGDASWSVPWPDPPLGGSIHRRSAATSGTRSIGHAASDQPPAADNNADHQPPIVRRGCGRSAIGKDLRLPTTLHCCLAIDCRDTDLLFHTALARARAAGQTVGAYNEARRRSPHELQHDVETILRSALDEAGCTLLAPEGAGGLAASPRQQPTRSLSGESR